MIDILEIQHIQIRSLAFDAGADRMLYYKVVEFSDLFLLVSIQELVDQGC